MKQIIITVSGGMVENVYTNIFDEDIEVLIVDEDNAKVDHDVAYNNEEIKKEYDYEHKMKEVY